MAHVAAPQIPIAAILEELGATDVPRVRSGHAKMLCPFHPDSTPSASVSRFGFVCWACDRKGDAIKLLREERGLSFADAVELAASIAGVSDQQLPPAPRRGTALLEL